MFNWRCYRFFLVLLMITAIVAVALIGHLRTARGQGADSRVTAQKNMTNGNWNDAYVLYAPLALDPETDPKLVAEDLQHALECLSRLSRVDEMDDFREKVIAAHPDNWRVLLAAARSFRENSYSYGYLVAGKFYRGNHRGGGQYVYVAERDRVRALQLLQQAMTLVNGATVDERGNFFQYFASVVLESRADNQSWRLQYLTDLSVLPDYDNNAGYRGYGGSASAAPVTADGKPVYHYVPASWQAAQTDGERWRWLLQEAVKQNPRLQDRITLDFAQFLYSQFDVRTMGYGGQNYGSQQSDDTKKDESGPYDVRTLRDTETIARLANGIKRFTLPDEFNYVRLFKEVANGQGGLSDQACNMLGQIYEDRQQYSRAVEYWQRVKATDRVKQITGNWGQFLPISTQPAGEGATIDYRFRNGKRVNFTAQQVDTEKLLTDIKAYLKSNPKQLDWQRVNPEQIGYQLVYNNQTQYLTAEVTKWSQALTPLPEHFDQRVTITTPLKTAGAYLVTANMADGNVSRIILWVADMAIIKKTLAQSTLYYVADAVSGKAIPEANVEFFGYQQRWIQDADNRGGHYDTSTRDYAEYTAVDGQLVVPGKTEDSNVAWITIARYNHRMAFLGFSNVWYTPYYDEQYNQVKGYVITDRPVYRPGQAVKFKYWVNTAKYDQQGKSAFAGKSFTVRVTNQRNEKILEKSYTADEYGGFNDEFTLASGAVLGIYNIQLLDDKVISGGSFRVEEYKKPEFEVKVDAPTTPVMLGEKLTATINAKYYFGAPVTNAKVHYKILRTSYNANWYPIGRWDWFYGPGYWWFACDYPWYRGWESWGCPRPMHEWYFGWRPQPQPEVVAEVDVPIGADGTVKVEIDTALAKAIHADTDHRYEITAEVTDQSRRTIVGQGTVLVARKPFTVYAWVNHGYFRVGDVIQADFCARTLDSQPVQGVGILRLLRVTYRKNDKQMQPVETEMQHWALNTDERGTAQQKIKADQAGQYRLRYQVTDAKGHTIEGGYLFTITGKGFTGSQFRFNDIELIPDKREYLPGETVHMLLNTNHANATVLLFIRPVNGVYLAPKIIQLDGKSTVVDIPVTSKDMPNFFVEALTISDGKVYTETREIIVPPEKRVLNVAITPSAMKYKPGEQGTFQVKVTDVNGKPVQGSTAVSIYDKSVEYISGGSNIPEIKEFFWKWRRNHYPRTESSLTKGGSELLKKDEKAMATLGIFGGLLLDNENQDKRSPAAPQSAMLGGRGGSVRAAKGMMADGIDSYAFGAKSEASASDRASLGAEEQYRANGQAAPNIEPAVRSNFADTAYWNGNLTTNAQGEATVQLKMPENLTSWKTRVWAMGDGAAVGEGSSEVVTAKNLLVRLQAPRFFTQKDEVVLSANIHNYLTTSKQVTAVLEIDEKDGAMVTSLDAKVQRRRQDGWELSRVVTIPANAEQRVDWRVRIDQPGQVVVRMKALTNEESDAMQMTFPAYVHGMLKTESFCGVIRPDKDRASITLRVPAERRSEQTRLEIRYSPTLAGAMVDALPYLAEYPYGCTESTLNRFLPAVITQQTLLRMGVNLKDIQAKRTNLNAQEIGNDVTRAQDWMRMDHPWGGKIDPIFDEAVVRDMVQAGLERLTSMQCADGGWGWFSGWGEQSYPHTTALVVHGMQIARSNKVAVPPDVLQRGISWLQGYQDTQLKLLQLWEKSGGKEGKQKADAIDAFVYMVLVDENLENKTMRDYLYRDRIDLPIYAKAMFGLALHKVGDMTKRDMLINNIDQFLVQDDENQTAYLRLPESNYWWCWYGSEYEAQAYYLKLLCLTDPKGEKASRLVKYLINNRKNATYWNSTRDTATVVEAFADYLKASGEDAPDMSVNILIDGKTQKTVKIDRENLFSFDNKLILTGDALSTGEHTVELVKTGKGPLYFNAYLTNFTLEDSITHAGLEVKVARQYYKLNRVAQTAKVAGDRGQAIDQQVEKYTRQALPDLSTVKSGDLIEIELTVEAKNDYEYILMEDMKAAGFEPVDVRSGYTGNALGAYMELHDERVCFFVPRLARGLHSISYRLRAEIPGKFSALPTKISAMYAPELKGNSDEVKLKIED